MKRICILYWNRTLVPYPRGGYNSDNITKVGVGGGC